MNPSALFSIQAKQMSTAFSTILALSLLVTLLAPTSDCLTLALKKLNHPPATTTISKKLPSAAPETAVKHLFSGVFYTDLSIGTPPLKLSLLIDTGSTTTWVQSAQCTRCFNVTSPNFDPNNSSTFQPVSPHKCINLSLTPSGNACTYEIVYGTGKDFTKGTFGEGTLSLGLNQSTPGGFAFGLGLENTLPGFSGNSEHQNPLSGILALGRDDLTSFLYQFESITRLKFSYCLPYNEGDQGSLRFGNEAQIAGPGVQSTPILGDFAYFLNMTGITFNSVILPIDPRVFMSEDGDSSVIIDTGADISIISPAAYSIIRRAVESYFEEEFSIKPLNVSTSLFGEELCFNLTDVIAARKLMKMMPPPMTWHFDGADMELGEATLFKEIEELNEYCLMMARGSRDLIIFGAFQQLNRRFFYDVDVSRLSFAPENC